MTPKIQDMTSGSPASLLIRFALPLMAGNVFQQVYTVVDTMVVGKALGVGALAALGAADWLNWMMLGMIQGFTQGFAILMAQAFGAKDFSQLRKVVGNSSVLCIVSAVLLVVFGQLLLEPVLRLMQTPAEIFGDSRLYLRIMYTGIPIVMAYNLFACVLRAMGDGRTPLYAMIVSCGVNVGLDLLFVLVFHWGIGGAAIATLIAQGCSALFCLWQLRRVDTMKLGADDIRPDIGLAGRLSRLGSTMAFQYMLISVGGLVVQFVVNGCGVLFVAGFTATSKLYGVLEIAATSFVFAVVTYVGQNLGAGRIDRIRLGQRSAYLLSLITSVIIAAVMILFGKFILSGFISGTDQEVEQAMKIAYHYLVVMSTFLPALYILYVARSALQGFGNTVLPFLSGVVELIMRVGAVFLLPPIVGQQGIFYAEILAWIGADFVLMPGYLLVVRKFQRE